MFRRALFLMLSVALAVICMSANPARAASGYSAFGDTADVGGGTALISDNVNGIGYGGLDFALPGAVTFADITYLGTYYAVEDDDDCSGGSPRFQIGIAGVGNVFVYIGDLANFNCSVTEGDTGNLLEYSDLRFDLSQVGGSFYDSYANALALVGGSAIDGIQLVVDGGWAFADGEQTIIVSPTVDISYSVGPPTSKSECKNGGWQSFNVPRVFANQGDCIQYVNTGK